MNLVVSSRGGLSVFLLKPLHLEAACQAAKVGFLSGGSTLAGLAPSSRCSLPC